MPRKTFHEELDDLQNDVVKMGDQVEQAVNKSLDALLTRNKDLAEEVVKEDDVIDEMHMSIEERSLHMLARQQPVAKDLRLLSSILKISLHLERMGDYSFNIAKIVRRTAGGTEAKEILDIFNKMASTTREIVAGCIKVFKKQDLKMAHALPEVDVSIDEDFKKLIWVLSACLADETCDIEWSTAMILASRNIERLADHAVDIAEQVVYLITGELEELD